MRKISATYIFPGNHAPLKKGIITCKSDGTILDIIDTGGKLKEEAGLEYYNGILVPGFINTHCHLELSHLRGKILKGRGINYFLGALNRQRKTNYKDILQSIKTANLQMESCGIAAVGDISNTNITNRIKKSSKIFYYTFIETFGFDPSRAERAINLAKENEIIFQNSGLPTSITPHSAYSVSTPLFKKLQKIAIAKKSILSIHNRESLAEQKFFNSGKGPIANHFKDNLNIALSHRRATTKNSLEYILQFIPRANQLLLVHNTYCSKKDLTLIKKQRSLTNTYFVLCPNSNLYIENQLPPITLLKNENLNICLGTDSFASNDNLSILEEIKTLQNNFEHLSLAELIDWACYNGACALSINKWLGSFEQGKNPGINLITHINFEQMKLTPKSNIKVLQPAPRPY